MSLSALKMFAPYSGSAASAPGGRGNGATNRVAVWADGNNLTSISNFTNDGTTFNVPQILAAKGTDTNNDAAAGNIGEYLESNITSDTDFGATGQYFDLTSRSLTAGDWDVSLLVRVNPNSGTITTPLEVGISVTTGNSSTGLSAVNTFRIDTPASTTTTISGVVPVYRMSLAATTTVYAKMFSNYTGSPKFQCRLSARRVR